MKRNLERIGALEVEGIREWLNNGLIEIGYNVCPFRMRCALCADIFPHLQKAWGLAGAYYPSPFGCPCEVYNVRHIEKVVLQILREKETKDETNSRH